MKIRYPEYGNSIANLACSIMKYYGVENVENPTLPAADGLLAKGYKNVVILLLDGMGKCILDRNLEKDGFFNSHLVTTYSSVFPPTTVAATTSVASGLYPSQHGWLGWDCYYPQIDKTVTVFMNRETESKKPIEGYAAAETFCPYETVMDRIRKAGGMAYSISAFDDPYPQDLAKILQLTKEKCKEEGSKYIYAYWDQPDSTMHKKGCYSEEAIAEIRKLEKQIREWCEDLKDTLVLITADHGMMDSEGYVLTETPEIQECLERIPSIEPRAINLFVKAGMEAEFEQRWKHAYGDDFLLLSKKEVLEGQLFGPDAAQRLDGMLGDYLAAAVRGYSLYNTQEKKDYFIGVHAGLTEDEVCIPLIAIET